MRYDYKISHLLGKSNFIADVLSRCPIDRPQNSDISFVEEISEFSDSYVSNLQNSGLVMRNLSRVVKSDNTCNLVTKYTES